MSNSWIDEIQTDKIKSSLTVAITDNKISFTEMLNILTDSANSVFRQSSSKIFRRYM